MTAPTGPTGPTGPPGPPARDRADAMGRRLDRTAARLGLDADGRALVLDVYRVAMRPRRSRLPDDHHPDYLHPARTALILMDDAGVADPVTLAAALLVETRDPSLAAPADAARRVSPEAAALAAAVPVPDREERLIEALLALPDAALRVAAAERLDHARHLHLRDEAEWAYWHDVTREVYVPVARRVDAALTARLDGWCETFARRYREG